MPNITTQPLKVTKITSDSITISWERWAGSTVNPDPIIYKVGLTEHDNTYDPWHVVKQGRGIYSYTFTGLKSNVMYAFYVKACDESGQVCQYPITNGCMTAKTLAPDTVAPTVTNRSLTVTRTTSKTIAIKWEPASDNVTGKQNIIYKVYCKLSGVPSDPWHQVNEAKGISSYTFKGLKPNTKYAFYVRAFDEAGNFVQYPLNNGCMTATTKPADTEPPTVDIRGITVLEASGNQIIIRWNPATDNETAAKDILYQVYYKRDNDTGDPWHLDKEAKNIITHTITGLKNKTRYALVVKAIDEAGNVLQYPLDNGCMTTVTDSANSKLVIQKAGSVYCDGLYSTNSKHNLFENMGSKFNRNYFELSFDMYPLATDTDDLKNDNIITIDSSYRIFSLIMQKGLLHAVINNDYFHPIALGTRYAANKWQHVWVVYDNGTLKLNGVVTRQVGKLSEKGNNCISNMNYSNAHAFKGYIRNLVVKAK